MKQSSWVEWPYPDHVKKLRPGQPNTAERADQRRVISAIARVMVPGCQSDGMLIPERIHALETLNPIARLHLITSRQNAAGVHETLKRLSLTAYFEKIVVVAFGHEATFSKSAHLKAVGAIAHCGDTEIDGQAAAAAGIPFWAVSSGQRSGGFLAQDTKPDLLRPSLHDIVLVYVRT